MEIKKLRKNAILPKLATDGSAAYDLHACIDKPVTLHAGECKLIPTGFAINMIRKNLAALILPRSGLGAKKGVVLGNLVGLIDSDYTGEIMLTPWNRNLEESVVINPNDRIAQMIFVPVIHPEFKEVDEFSSYTKRGSGGFGSTGV